MNSAEKELTTLKAILRKMRMAMRKTKGAEII